MKTILTLASAAALAATTLTANAWWGGPYGPYAGYTPYGTAGLTADQQKAMADQQKKAMEQMMAAQRKMAEQMAARRAEIAKQMKDKGYDPMMANPFFAGPGAADPFSAGPWGVNPFDAAYGPMGPEPSFADPWGTDPFAAAPKMPESPKFGEMPEPDMTGPFGTDIPMMPAMPEPYGMDMPGMPPMDVAEPALPAFVRDHYKAMESYRAKVMKESNARREKAIEAMSKRREQLAARLHRYGYPHPFMMPYGTTVKTPAAPTVPKAQSPVPASKDNQAAAKN